MEEYDNIELFQLALCLTEPWKVQDVNLSLEKERLDIYSTSLYSGGNTILFPVEDTVAPLIKRLTSGCV